jgi:hypothetical protein
MLWDALHFFVNLTEVIVSVALILIVGVTVAKIAFWMLSRTLGKLAGSSAASDPSEDEAVDYAAIPGPTDDSSIPTEDGRPR